MIDLPLSAWFHANQIPLATKLMLLVSLWHSTIGILTMSAVLGLVLYRYGRTWWLLALALAVPGGMLLNVLVKNLVQRPRPHFADAVLTLPTYSFPSGHTAGAALFYGFLTALVFAHPGARRWRWAMAVAAVAMVLLVGLSRIYLGLHYFTDVAGAIVEAVLWLALCLAGVRALWRRRGGEAAHG
ncbi:phosphatase PAP2 family protein [Caenimonas terrae]|uniref:Phosphatase PAP2 family protein n=1 Tax=Caenimonas terrae TaxID=696074 RepID=A0ABW0NCY9_9BURK